MKLASNNFNVKVEVASYFKTQQQDILHQDHQGGANHSGSIVHITNQKYKQRLTYGPEFAGLLDARDQVLEHNFDFTIDLNKYRLR